MPDSQRAVLITGCSTGIGRAAAVMLAQRGFQVFGGVRNEANAAELKGLHQAITPVQLDVTNEQDLANVVEIVNKNSNGLYGLVNNAGIGLPSAVELTTPDELRLLFEVNTIAPLKLIQAFLPNLRKSRGRIVNVTSLNGNVALPMVGAYSASKFALEALSDTLRVELRPWGILVSTVRPGQVRTAIFAKAGEALKTRATVIPDELRNGYDKMYARGLFFNQRGVKSPTSPEAVAKAIYRALISRYPMPHYHVGADAKLLKLGQLTLPTTFLDRIIARLMGTFKRLG